MNIMRNSKRKSNLQNLPIISIKQSEYINAIIKNNIIDKYQYPLSNIKTISSSNNIFLIHLIRKMNYICSSNSNYKQLKNDKFLNLFLYLALNILEYKPNTKGIKELLFKNYILLLNKLYLHQKLSLRDISILIKFITISSVYKRKDISKDNINQLKKVSEEKIKYYETIEFVIDIIKKLNISMITMEFCEFLNANFLSVKSNIFIITEKTKLLELLFLNDQNDFILDFLSKIYSFRTNKSILGLFINKIKDIYKERRDKNISKENELEMNNSFLNLLNNLSRSILFINSLKQNEENKSKDDSFFPKKGFVFNNSKSNGLYTEKVIVQNCLTIVFSFRFSPDKQNVNKNDIEYPIIFACPDKDPKDCIYFYIKNNDFYYKQSKANKNFNICNIKKDQTYLVYYSVKEHDNLVLAIKSDNFEFEISDVYRDFLKKNLTIRVGRYDRQNFEGYIGSILIFKEYFDNDYKNFIFSLKGDYDKILYFHDYNTCQLDKYDKYINHILNDGNFSNYLEIKEENKKIFDKNIKKGKDKKNKNKSNIVQNTEIKLNNRDYFLKLSKKLKEENIINSSLLCYISPLFSKSALRKNYFTNSIFVETLIKKFVTDPKTEISSTIFYKNKSFIFQFLKYDGISYLILTLELIIVNYDNIKTKEHQKLIVDIFKCILIFTTGLLSYIKIESYLNEISKFLFCVKKFFIKFSKMDLIGDEIHLVLNEAIQNFDVLNEINFTEDKKHYINGIKTEICKILLNAELYDLNNFTLINQFMKNFLNFIEKQNNSSELLNINLFKKIIDFAQIYDKINIKNDKIKKDKQFKLFKNYFSKIIINFVKKSESLEIYTNLFNIFSNDLKFNYLKYQSIKLFYLVSENYFDNVDESTLFKSWKYFVDLFEYFEKKENNKSHSNIENDINEKEEHIIMSICLRVIIENIKYKEFFKLKLNKTIDEIDLLENLLLKTKEEGIKKNINSSLIYSLKSSGYWTNTNTIQNIYNKKTDLNININLNSKKKRERSKSFSLNNEGPKENIINDKNQDIKRINTYKGKEINEKSKNHSSKNLLNYQETSNLNNILDIDAKKKEVKNKYTYYYSFHYLYSKLSKSSNLNDYCFKAMLLFILEKNNKVIIPQNIKYNFLLKVKKYDDLKNPEYKSFLCIKTFNKKIKKEFIIFIKIIESNKNRLSSICYDILLYILIQIIKDREHSRNIISLFMESKKICNKLFKYAFLYNKQSTELIIKEFPLFIKLLLPYHRKLFIAYLLYDSVIDIYIHNNYSEKLFNLLLNTKIDIDNNNMKNYYDFLINKIIILYHIFKSEKIFLDEKIELDEKGILDLADENLIYSKYDILFTKKRKCYVEMLFEFILNVYIKSNNSKYRLILDKIFIENINKIKKSVKGAKTIIFYIDKATIKDDKKNPCLKYYNKNAKIEISLCINFLIETLKYSWKCRNENNEVKSFLQKLINNFFEDSILIYKENKIYRKKDKNNEWYNFIIDNLHEIINNKREIKIEEIQQKIIEKNNSDLKKKEDKNLNLNNENSMLSFNESNIINLSTTKSNSEIDFSNISDNENDNENIVENRNSINKTKDEKNKNPNKINDSNIVKNNIVLNESEILKFIRSNIAKTKNQYSIIKNISRNDNTKYNYKYLDIENINFRTKAIIFPKNDLLEQRFSIYFTDILFYNKLFILLKSYYKYYIKKITKKEIDIHNFFNYPIIIRNYTPENIFFGEFFVKNDLNFFSNRLTKISHKYFMDILKNFNTKEIRIFPKKTEQDDIHNFLIEKQINDSNIFYVDLVTNRNVVFGKLVVSKNMIYFETLSKDEFLKKKTDSAKEQWLLCSLDCDYSNRQKKVYIFKSEIREIINRRFLYLFQACELFLKNGKSYYFNFYSEQKKIQFFSIFKNEKNSYNIDIIYDIKSSFKKKNYTKKWMSNELSTLEYLLLLNKFSSRSYNDINQYPVFPWLEIYDNAIRDLKYPIAAQTEDERMIKKEMYLASSEKFPYHYTTHYSNSAYLAYYLVRTNPFTNNQINLQVDKFDNPMRQFNAIDEILKILKHTSQPREVIPEFYLSTEFYYNYNCNFYGITDEGELIHNLNNKIGFNSPLEYILHNLLLLETPDVKKEINYFFDNIYGVGQMGGIDSYNIYNKYSYQEMFDLREKITKYKKQNLKYNTIKQKIISKCNKIISFGQTPFKILEDKHPQWMPKKEINEIQNQQNTNLNTVNTIGERTSLNPIRPSITFYADDKENNILGIKISANIIFIQIYSIIYKEHIKQCIFVFNRITKFKYELKIYDNKFKDFSSSLKNITIPKEIKLFSKLKIFNNKFLHAYKYNPKNVMINLKLSFFIFCHFNDNSFKIFTPKGENYSVITESMITCITKISENSFLTGHFNGKIIMWEIPFSNNEKELSLNDFNKIIIKKNFMAHQSRVNNIIYCEKVGIIISSGDDKKIFIRKFYDLTLFTMIELSNEICIDIKIKHFYIYTLLFDEIKQKYIIKIFSFNGKEVGKSDYDYINNFTFDKDGNLLIGYYKKDYIDIYEPSLVIKLGEIPLIINEQAKILSNSKKNNVKLDGNIRIGDDILLMNFYYNKLNNSVYCSLSNGFLFCKILNNNN